MLKVILVTQARVGSTRLPGKILKTIGGKTLLEIHLDRIKKCRLVDSIVVATTYEEGTELISEIANKTGVTCFQGDTDDVLDRFYQATKDLGADLIVRLTSDCPLIDPILIDHVIDQAVKTEVDYCSNGLTEDFPDGQDVEVFKFSALAQAWGEAKLGSEREHVTPYIRKHSNFNRGGKFSAHDFKAPKNMNHVRMTVDEETDFIAMEHLIAKLGTEKPWYEYAIYIIENANQLANQSIVRNEGYLKSIQKDKE